MFHVSKRVINLIVLLGTVRTVYEEHDRIVIKNEQHHNWEIQPSEIFYQGKKISIVRFREMTIQNNSIRVKVESDSEPIKHFVAKAKVTVIE